MVIGPGKVFSAALTVLQLGPRDLHHRVSSMGITAILDISSLVISEFGMLVCAVVLRVWDTSN
jgi:hypothetical protein